MYTGWPAERYVCLHACAQNCMHACMHVCMHACMHACVADGIYVCVAVRRYVCLTVRLSGGLSVFLFVCLLDALAASQTARKYITPANKPHSLRVSHAIFQSARHSANTQVNQSMCRSDRLSDYHDCCTYAPSWIDLCSCLCV